MKKIALILALALATTVASAAQTQWAVKKTTDKITDEVSVTAWSPIAFDEKREMNAAFAIECDGDIIFFTNTVDNSIDYWDVDGGIWNLGTFRSRWRADEAAGVEEDKGPTSPISFLAYGSPVDMTASKIADASGDTLARIKKHPSVLVEVPFAYAGRVYFDINLKNAAAAIEELEKECAALKK